MTQAIQTPTTIPSADKIGLVLMALMTTLWGYQFGGYDHQEHFPLFFRTQNPNYLPNDFFINANEQGFDPRYYFSLLLMVLNKVLSLPLIYLLLVWGCNVAIGWASYKAAKRLFAHSDKAGLFAAVAVLSVPTVEWGSVAMLHADYLTPNIMAFSLVLCAWVAIWEARWRTAGLYLGIASLLHPLVGPECGAVLLGLAGLQQLWVHRFRWQAYMGYLQGLFLFIVLTLIPLLPYFVNSGGDGDDLSKEEFIRLYAYFRNPHHIIPSQFLSPEEWQLGEILLGLCLLGWIRAWLATADSRTIQLQLIGAILCFLLLAGAGYLLVEVYPVRLVATAQAFRLLYIVKWITWIGVGGYLGWLWDRGGYRLRIESGGGMIALFAWWNTWLMALAGGLLAGIERKWKIPFWLSILHIALVAFFAARALYHSYLTTEWGAEVYLWAAFLLFFVLPALLPASGSGTAVRSVAGLSVAGLLLGYWLTHVRTDDMRPLQRALSRQYDLQDLRGDLPDIAQKIKELTPPDAILVTPPMHSELRYLADRALVGDFKTYPFKGKAMLEWEQRLFDLYGWTDKKGFDAVRNVFKVNYEYTPDEKFKMLAQKYGGHYAVQWKVNPTQYPVLYENATYRLVHVP